MYISPFKERSHISAPQTDIIECNSAGKLDGELLKYIRTDVDHIHVYIYIGIMAFRKDTSFFLF